MVLSEIPKRVDSKDRLQYLSLSPSPSLSLSLSLSPSPCLYTQSNYDSILAGIWCMTPLDAAVRALAGYTGRPITKDDHHR